MSSLHLKSRSLCSCHFSVQIPRAMRRKLFQDTPGANSWPGSSNMLGWTKSGDSDFQSILPPYRYPRIAYTSYLYYSYHMRITSKGQVTIPQHIRKKAGFLPETEVEFEMEGNVVRIRKVKNQQKKSRGQRVVEHLRRFGKLRMSTDEIMALTRGE